MRGWKREVRERDTEHMRVEERVGGEGGGGGALREGSLGDILPTLYLSTKRAV